MQKYIVTIRNRLGLHARAAAQLTQLSRRFQSSVVLVANGRRADARSIVAVMVLAASFGARVSIEVNGPDELEASTAVTRLINERFGEGD